MTIHGQRLWLTNDAAGAVGMDRMNAGVEAGARDVAAAKVDVVAYGCTTRGAFAVVSLGREADGEASHLWRWAGLGEEAQVIGGVCA